jgi:phosphoglycerate dehydrogenase-like enzyme
MKNIKIAFFFGGNGYSSNFKSLKTKLNHDGFNLDIRYIKTLYSLLKFSPEILITHESYDLNNYLLLSPNNLKWLNIMSAGVDKTLAFLKLNNIPPEYLITSTKGIHKNAISEYVIASILYFEKNIYKINFNKKIKKWDRFPLTVVSGKRLLIYGVGQVGSALALKFSSLGIKVSGVSLNTRYKKNFSKIFSLEESLEILPSFDYVINCMPLTEFTKNFFSLSTFKHFKKNSIFVNISRGEIVDEDSLVYALDNDMIYAAVLDCFVIEPLPKKSKLWARDDVFLTPHISGFFVEGKEKGINLFRKNLVKYIKGDKLLNLVCPDKGY